MKHRTFYFVGILALFFGFGSADLCAANIEVICDVENGFNVQRDQQKTIGYITSLTIGTTTLRPDLNVKDPTKEGSPFQAVAVLGKASWNGGATDFLNFTAQISTPNKQAVAMLLRQKLSNPQAQIAFKAFEYDPVAKKYFVVFAPAADTGLKGSVAKSETGIQLSVAPRPDSTVKSPENFEMAIQLAPAPLAQTIRFATADLKSVVKKWGVSAHSPPGVRDPLREGGPDR